MNISDFNFGTRITPEPYILLSTGDGKDYILTGKGWLDVIDEEYISEAKLLARYPHIICNHDFIERGSEFSAGGGYGHDDNIVTACRHCGTVLHSVGWATVPA